MFVLTRGVVDVGAGTVPYYYVIANLGGLAGGLLVSWTLDRFGRTERLHDRRRIGAGARRGGEQRLARR